ncbi:hypothetical protein Q0T32_04575 [Escherichia coli O87:H39]
MELNNQFSKEQLIGHAQQRCKVIEEIIADPSTDPVSRDYYRREVVMGKIALAALTAEPIAWTDEQELRDVEKGGCGYLFTVKPVTPNADPRRVIKLYVTPPVQVAPKTLPCSVELKPGLIIGKGCKTETLLTALKRRADFYAELDAMTPEEKAEYAKNIEAFKEMLLQPAPAVPEERPSLNNGIIGFDEGWNACRAAMLKGGAK